MSEVDGIDTYRQCFGDAVFKSLRWAKAEQMLLKLAVKTSGTPCGTRFKHVQSALVPQSVPFQDRQNRFDSLCGGCCAQRIAGHVVNEPQPRVCPQRHKRSGEHVVHGTC